MRNVQWKCSWLVVLIATSALIGTNLAAAAPRFETLSEARISGSEATSRASFSSTRTSPGAVTVEVRLPNGKAVIAHVDYNLKTTRIRSVIGRTQRLVALDRDDVTQLRALAASIDRLPNQTGDALGSLTAYLSKAPAGIVLDLSSEGREGKASSDSLCELPNPQGGFNAQGHFTYKHHTYNPLSSVDCYQFSNGCLGRCGKGCATDVFPLNSHNDRTQQRLTQACLNHDWCVIRSGEKVGACPGQCCDEFRAAFDDYFHATDCASMTGKWAAFTNIGSPWNLVEQSNYRVTGTSVAGPLCGSYNITGVHAFNVFKGTATRPFPPMGCPASVSFKMKLQAVPASIYSSCNNASDSSITLNRVFQHH